MRRWCLALVLVLSAMSARLDAQQFVPTGRATLRGLPGVEVVVEPLSQDLTTRGLTTEGLGAAVARQLRESGVTVYATQRDNPSPSKPYVYVHVLGLVVDPARVAVAIQVHLRQTLVSLTTESKVVDAMSWDAHDVIVSPSSDVAAAVRSEVQDLVGTFVEDWRAVH